MMKKIRHKYYNKPITTRDSGYVQYHDHEESKLINKIIKSPISKNNVAALKSK